MTHKFGGEWTEQKLRVLAKYLNAYMQIMKGRNFKIGYIDAFAGTGSIDGVPFSTGADDLFEGSADSLPGFLKGSARIALDVVPPFDRYVFIERDAERAKELTLLRDEVPSLHDRIVVVEEEANGELLRRSKASWDDHRAVLFLDPYGTQVEWGTLEAIARRTMMDIFLLFPTGVAINRMLTSDGRRISDGWKNRLNKIYGTGDWEDRFYRASPQPDFLEESATPEKIAGMEDIVRYYIERLQTVFPKGGVYEKPLPLKTPTGRTLYHLCFAVSNPSEKAIKPAMKIFRDIIAKEL